MRPSRLDSPALRRHLGLVEPDSRSLGSATGRFGTGLRDPGADC
jgi:hypothetical protein